MGGAYAGAGEQDLGDGGVDDPVVGEIIHALQFKALFVGDAHVGAELVAQALGDGESTAHAAGDILILTDAENGGVPAHLFSDSAFQRVSDRHHSHGIQPSQNTCSNAELSSGSGAALAYSTASSISPLDGGLFLLKLLLGDDALVQDHLAEILHRVPVVDQ